MVLRTQRKLTALVISLVVQVISLSGIAFAVATPPSTIVKAPITTGMRAPMRIAKDGGSPANYYVSDARARGVVKVSPSGNITRTYQTATSPGGVAIGTGGTTSGKILVGQGTYISVIDQTTGAETAQLGQGQFASVNGIAVSTSGTSAGYIFAVDTVAQAVNVFDPDGVFKTSFTSWVGGPATTFSGPTGIAYEKVNSQIAVANTEGGNVLFFTVSVSGGTVSITYAKFTGRTQWDNNPVTPLYFLYPTGVAFDYVGGVLNRMYVVDAFHGNIQAIDPTVGSDPAKGTGTFLSYVGTAGMNASKGQLMMPTDAAYDDTSKLLLVASANSSVIAFGVDTGGWVAPPTSPTVIITDPVGTPDSGGTLVINGTSANADQIVISVPAPATATQPAGAVGTWSSTISNIPPGGLTVRATASNSGSATAYDEAVVAFTPDWLALTATPVAVTNAGKHDVTGTVTVDAGVTCQNVTSGSSLIPAVVAGTAWTCKDVPLQAGSNAIQIVANKTGYAQKTLSPNVAIVRDVDSPVVAVSAIAAGRATTTQLQNVSGTVTDAYPATTVTVNGEAVNVVNGKFSAAVVLGQGQNKIEIAAADQAGNVTTAVRYVDFDFDFVNERPVITIAAPADGVVTQSGSVNLSGSVTNADLLTVAGSPVTINGDHTWTATGVALASGMNTVEIVATNTVRAKESAVKRTLFYDTTLPDVAVTVPLQDLATKSANNLAVQGTAAVGATVTAQFNGASPSVSKVGSNYTIDLPLPQGTISGVYPLVITATGTTTSTVVRNILVDRVVPALAVDKEASNYDSVRGTSDNKGTARIVFSNGLNNPVGIMNLFNDGSWIADLAGVSYTASAANVTATDVAGNSANKLMLEYINDGDMNSDRIVTIGDALICMRTLVASELPTLAKLAHGDCAPVNANVCQPNGQLELADCLLILRRSVGLDASGPLQPVP